MKGDLEEAKVSGAGASLDVLTLDTERLPSGQRRYQGPAKHALCLH